ncbi:MAG: TVP38/TMEM64 family protein [Alphaproteobacteria bacterium]
MSEKSRTARRFLPVFVLLAVIAAFFAFDLDTYVTFETLRENRGFLQNYVAMHGVVAILVFAFVYAVTVVVFPPGGAIMTITGGFLFGTLVGGTTAVLAATVGATALFLVVRYALGDALRDRAGPFVSRMEAGFRENAMSYLLVLRLIPLFPFWVVNLVPAFLGVRTGTYVLGTFVGIIPGTFVYASVGNGLGVVFDAGETPDLGIIFSAEILLPILGLALLALLPVAYKRFQERRKPDSPAE